MIVYCEFALSGRLVKLCMHDDGRLKLVRLIVAISSGVVFARARQKWVLDGNAVWVGFEPLLRRIPV